MGTLFETADQRRRRPQPALGRRNHQALPGAHPRASRPRLRPPPRGGDADFRRGRGALTMPMAKLGYTSSEACRVSSAGAQGAKMMRFRVVFMLAAAVVSSDATFAAGLYDSPIPDCGSVCDWPASCSAAERAKTAAVVAACKADHAASVRLWNDDLVAVFTHLGLAPADVPVVLDCIGRCAYPRWPRPRECSRAQLAILATRCQVSHM